MEYQIFKLENGIRLVHKFDKREVAHCGITINTGSRDELEEENGIAHFIEHVIFKGTKKRKAYHVLSRLEDVGADLNAYTSKEETCIYASFLHEHYARTLELISDITFNSVFPAKELEKEKDVVLDEINSYKDSPSEEIFDEFEEVLFDGHPIARNILGTPQKVKTFKKKDILNFIKNNYHTDQMVISSVGNISFDKLVKLVNRYFGEIPANLRTKSRIEVNSYQPDTRIIQKETYLSHCLYGNIAYKREDEKRLGLFLINNSETTVSQVFGQSRCTPLIIHHINLFTFLQAVFDPQYDIRPAHVLNNSINEDRTGNCPWNITIHYDTFRFKLCLTIVINR